MITATVTQNIIEASTSIQEVKATVLNYFDVSTKENTGVAESLVTAHEAAADPHPQYATEDWVVANIPLSPKLQKKLVVTVGGVGSGENFEGDTWDTIKAAYDSLSEGQMVLVKNKGTAYTVNRRAVATATVSGGVITSLTLNYAGYGYTSAPTITITSGGGTGATATCTVSALGVATITLTNGGSGYVTPSAISINFSGGGNTLSSRIVPKSNTKLIAEPGVKVTGSVTGDYLILNPSSNGSQLLLRFQCLGFEFDLQNTWRGSGIQLRDASSSKVRLANFKNGAANSWFTNFSSEPSGTTSVFGYDNIVEDCIFDTHNGSLEMELALNQVNYKSKNNTYKNKTGDGPCLGLWQKTKNTIIENPRFIDNDGFCIYYSNSTDDTTVISPYSENSGTLLQGSNVSDNLNNGPLGGYNYGSTLTVRNLIAKGGINSTQAVAVQIGAVYNFDIEITLIEGYQQGIAFGRGNNGNSLPAKNGRLKIGTIKNLNPLNVNPDLAPAFYFGKSSPDYNVTIEGGDIYDDRTTPLGIQPVFFDANDSVTTATATVSGGAVTAISVNNVSNNGYETVPTVTITGGGGTGATAIANMDTASNGGKIISFTVTNPGTGYSTAPTVTVANTTQNNTFGGIRFINTRLEAYGGRDSIKKAGAVTLNNTVEFCGIRNKTMGSLAQYYKEYGQLNTLSLPTYTDNASAISGGLAVGDLYKTSTGELRIRI